MSYRALIIVLFALLVAFIGCGPKKKEVEPPVYTVPDAVHEWFEDDLDDLPEAGQDSGDADEGN